MNDNPPPAAVLAQVPSADRWGPWDPLAATDPAEHRARLRALRAIVRLACGPRGVILAAHLGRAEWDPTALVPALAALNDLAANDRRHVLASYAELNRSAPSRAA